MTSPAMSPPASPSASVIEPARRPGFPFTALVGQPLLQRALLLAAIDPGIGGVLISGPRGTAKSTAARALAGLLPQAPFVTLPLAASVEQLVGTLAIEDVLRDGSLRLAPGLLARAHNGILYVDEVNLLPDALIDALLDAAASGVNTIERDGISRQHAARFVLVGTMNPEEGELRPQLLDRFGLSVTLANPTQAEQRQAILRERLGFDDDPHAVSARHAAGLQQLSRAIAAAREALPRLSWPDAVLGRAAERALAAAVDGVRADLVMLRAARALAAFEGRDAVKADDVDAVAELALAHRRTSAEADAPPQAGAGPASGSASSPAREPARDGDRDARAYGPASGAGEHRDAPDYRTAAGSGQAPEGDWGALAPEPEGYTRVRTMDGWPAKKP